MASDRNDELYGNMQADEAALLLSTRGLPNYEHLEDWEAKRAKLKERGEGILDASEHMAKWKAQRDELEEIGNNIKHSKKTWWDFGERAKFKKHKHFLQAFMFAYVATVAKDNKHRTAGFLKVYYWIRLAGINKILKAEKADPKGSKIDDDDYDYEIKDLKAIFQKEGEEEKSDDKLRKLADNYGKNFPIFKNPTEITTNETKLKNKYSIDKNTQLVITIKKRPTDSTEIYDEDGNYLYDGNLYDFNKYLHKSSVNDDEITIRLGWSTNQNVQGEQKRIKENFDILTKFLKSMFSNKGGRRKSRKSRKSHRGRKSRKGGRRKSRKGGRRKSRKGGRRKSRKSRRGGSRRRRRR